MPIRVLVVDDSLIFRAAVSSCFASENDITIVGQERNGRRALAFLDAHPDGVDLVTLDIEMPEMDGLATLDAITARNAQLGRSREIGVIMLSAHSNEGTRSTIRALQAGAFDFIAKPVGGSHEQNADMLRNQLLPRIRAWAVRRGRGDPATTHLRRPVMSSTPSGVASGGTSSIRNSVAATPGTISAGRRIPPQVVAIAVSTGGPRALTAMLPRLTSLVRLPILIVQHMPPRFTASLADSLTKACGVSVVEAEDGLRVEPGRVYIAPGGRHMIVRQTPNGAVCGVNDQPPENGLRPNADILFRSVHAVYGGAVIGVVLTGMGSDGCRGCGPLKRSGATIIAQDEASSVVWGMPGSVVAAGLADLVVPLDAIPDSVARFLR